MFSMFKKNESAVLQDLNDEQLMTVAGAGGAVMPAPMPTSMPAASNPGHDGDDKKMMHHHGHHSHHHHHHHHHHHSHCGCGK